MKTPLSYYGGKQQLANIILGLMPPHRLYCEPFLGGAAIFFAKEPSKVEIINDSNGEIINFYEVVLRDFTALEKEVAISLHSRKQHRQARVIYENPEMFDRIKRAWAVWMLANASYGHKLTGGYGYGRVGSNHSIALDNKRTGFTVDYAVRLQRAQIECCDALRIIRSRDVEDAFFYLDPPYVGADQGHYDGYTQEDFDNLLGLLVSIKGKFLLSSFRNKSLVEFTRKNKWHTLELRMSSPMTHGHKSQREKI
ncbi:MAG: DNA adenine methylase [Treponema sp.]|jgi:DNA adenine methylase|nr:DNA adenine methylase [Treponema sp.]